MVPSWGAHHALKRRQAILPAGHPRLEAQCWACSNAQLGMQAGRIPRLACPRRQAAEQREANERDWGEALRAVAAGLRGGRRLLWDDVGRRVGVLLAAPAAWEGEHFLQARQGRVG